MSKSEIARLRQELEASTHAAWLGLHGLAEVGKHITITKRMENMTASIQALANIVGDEQAIQVWIEIESQMEGGLIANPQKTAERCDILSLQPIEKDERKTH